MTKLYISFSEPIAATRRRPPGSRTEADLSALCTHCGDCVRVCPEGRIALTEEGTPMIVGPGACMQCGLCADVCSHDAIRLTRRTRVGLEMVHRLERLAG